LPRALTHMTELYSFRKATPWALLSMVAYAFQHPLVEPLAAQNRDGFLGYFSVLLFAELVPLGCLIILISQPKLKKNITFLFSSLENAKRVIILALLGTLSGLIYVVSVANLPLVYLALILNTMPIYAFVIGAFMHGVVPPRNVIFTSLVCWTGIFLTAGNTFIDQCTWRRSILTFGY